jgi:hypothetical protein
MKRRFGAVLPRGFKIGPIQPEVLPLDTEHAAVTDAAPTAVENSLPDGKNRISVNELADIATQAWRARTKMIDPLSGDTRDEMKRVIRHVDAIISTLTGFGFEIKDHTGDAFDYGQPLRLIATQPALGLTRETVLETLKPTIYWRGQIIQSGEVIVGVPGEQ